MEKEASELKTLVNNLPHTLLEVTNRLKVFGDPVSYLLERKQHQSQRR